MNLLLPSQTTLAEVLFKPKGALGNTARPHAPSLQLLLLLLLILLLVPILLYYHYFYSALAGAAPTEEATGALEAAEPPTEEGEVDMAAPVVGLQP